MTFQEILKKVNKDTIDVSDFSTRGLYDGGQQFEEDLYFWIDDTTDLTFVYATLSVDKHYHQLTYTDAPTDEIEVRNSVEIEIKEVMINGINLNLTRDEEKELIAKIKSVIEW